MRRNQVLHTRASLPPPRARPSRAAVSTRAARGREVARLCALGRRSAPLVGDLRGHADRAGGRAIALYDPTLPFAITFVADALNEQIFPPSDVSKGFEVGVTFNSTQAALGIGHNQISYSTPTSIGVNVASDNTVFHSFGIQWDGTAMFSYFIDGTLVGSAAGSTVSGSKVAPRLFFGDGVTFANAEVDLKQLTFSQSLPEPSSVCLVLIGLVVIASNSRCGRGLMRRHQ